MVNLKYGRILIKLSGEALMGNGQQSFDHHTIGIITQQIKQINDFGVQVGVVIGGGNFIRGTQAADLCIQRANADYMGILATIMNGIALRDFFRQSKIPTEVFSAIPIDSVVQCYNRDNMLCSLNTGNVVIFVGGIGSPFFTTDSGAALRALEMDAQLLIKATKVDGVYDKDPVTNPDAIKYEQISFEDAINKKLKVMDISAFDLCRSNKINMQVCNIFTPNVLQDIVTGNNIGTLVHY